MIEIKNLNKIYNESKENSFVALKDINLTIEKNELVILKGVSGSGKSTLLSIIGTFLKPTNGIVSINDETIVKLPDHFVSKFRSTNIGFVFQSFNLIDEFTVYENIASSLIPLKLSLKQIDEKIDKALNIAHISHKKEQTVTNLSGGEKQRVAIARAIVNEPSIILCDEPTANLDHENSIKFIEMLKELKKLDKTIIIATHDPLFDNLELIDKVYNIKDGQLVHG